MSAFRFRSSFSAFLLVITFSSPLPGRGQSAPFSPQANHYTVSVQDLKMSSKGQKAFDKGSQLLSKGDTAASLPYLDRAVAESPENYRAYYDLGLAHYRLGQITEAEQNFQKSIDLSQGGFALPQFGMGMLLCEKQDFQQAEAVLERGLALEPGSASGKYFLGWAQYGLNRIIEAERSLQQAILRNSHLGEAYLLLARIHQRQKNAPAMTKDLETYLKLNPHGPDSEQTRRLLQRTRTEMDARPIALLFPLLPF